MESISKPLAYIPDGAKINTKNEDMSPPKVRYEERRVEFPRDQVKEQITQRDTP